MLSNWQAMFYAMTIFFTIAISILLTIYAWQHRE